jgi:feruloyl esterase
MRASRMGVAWLVMAGALSGAPCENLSKLSLPHTAVTLAQVPAAGEFKDVPPFCRVAATLTPVSDSEIKIEVWLPVAGWNGKLMSVGNGGWNGTIGYGPLGAAVRRGYAAAATDTGHSGGRGSFALGHPEKVADFGYRAVHEMTVAAKAIIRDFYGDGPRYSYWSGCSTGGRQGLSEAQRYPADYDGIIAGAPANYLSRLHVWSIAVAQAVNERPESFIPPSKYAVLHRAALEACDALDGLEDGVIEDPTRCGFDPKVIQCQGEDGPACLTTPQVAAARKIYAAVKNPRTGGKIFPGMEPGSEPGWGPLAGKEAASIATDSFTYLIYQDPKWDWRTMNLDSDVARAD